VDKQSSTGLTDKIEDILTGETLSEAAKYYGIDKSRIVRTSINRSLIVGLTVGCSILIMHPLLGIILGAASFLATLSTLLGSYPKRLEKEKLEVEKYGTVFLETLSSTLASTESILKAVISVGNQGIPRISAKFRKIAKRIENGENPEDLILEFSGSVPSKTLSMAVRRIMNRGQGRGSPTKEIMDATERETRRYFENQTSQMESRITVIFAIDFFVPTIAVISASMLGFAQSPLIFLLIPFHLCLIDLAQTKIMERETDLLW